MQRDAATLTAPEPAVRLEPPARPHLDDGSVPSSMPRATPAHAPMHLGFLDGVRALAALYVVLHHVWLFVWRVEFGRAPAGWMRLLTGWLFYGHFAVTVFIAVSGYCLMLPVIRANGELRGGARTFFRRRAHRILPPLYCSLLISLVFILVMEHGPPGTLWFASSHVSKAGLAANVLLVQNLFGRGQINYVFWSVAVECQIYLLFPLIVLFSTRVGALWTAAGTLILAAGLFALGYGNRLSGLHAEYLAVFMLGTLAARLSFDRSSGWRAACDRCPWPLVAAGAAVVAAGLCMGLGWLRSYQLYPYLDLLVGFAAAALLLSCATGRGGLIGRLLSWRPLQSVGAFSYSIYLVHAFLLQAVWQYGIYPLRLAPNSQFLLMAAVALPVTVGGAYLFYLGCERPFLNRRPAS